MCICALPLDLLPSSLVKMVVVKKIAASTRMLLQLCWLSGEGSVLRDLSLQQKALWPLSHGYIDDKVCV